MIKRYTELDAFRGIAAVLVVMFHLTIGEPQSQLGFKFGVTGVDLFFIISGFVIFMSISKVSSPLEFIFNRISRLYPTYWACVTITFLLKIIQSVVFGKILKHSFLDYLGNMTMFQYLFKIKDIDGSYWTMYVEMLFYIFIVILFATKQIKFIVQIGSVILFFIFINDLWLENSFSFLSQIHKIYPLINHFPLFFAGIIFYKIMNYNLLEKKLLLLYNFLIPICFCVQLLLFDNGGRSSGYIIFQEYFLILLVYFSIFTLFVYKKIGFIVNKTTLFLGKISFSLYLIHQYVGAGIIIPIFIRFLHLGYWVSHIFALVIVIILAGLITYFIEIPMSKKMNNSLKTRFLKT